MATKEQQKGIAGKATCPELALLDNSDEMQRLRRFAGARKISVCGEKEIRRLVDENGRAEKGKARHVLLAGGDSFERRRYAEKLRKLGHLPVEIEDPAESSPGNGDCPYHHARTRCEQLLCAYLPLERRVRLYSRLDCCTKLTADTKLEHRLHEALSNGRGKVCDSTLRKRWRNAVTKLTEHGRIRPLEELTLVIAPDAKELKPLALEAAVCLRRAGIEGGATGMQFPRGALLILFHAGAEAPVFNGRWDEPVSQLTGFALYTNDEHPWPANELFREINAGRFDGTGKPHFQRYVRVDFLEPSRGKTGYAARVDRLLDALFGAYSTQICHPFQRKVATQSGVKLTTGRSAATRMVHC